MAGETQDCYRIFSLAGETFGHHIPYYHQTFLLDMLYALRESERVRLCRVSDLLGSDGFAKAPKRKETDNSQQYYWASIVNWRKDMRNIIYEGIDYQMRALYKAVRVIGNQELLACGRELYTKLMRELYRKDAGLDNQPS
uniref:Uncharacterized protein n=1 Tax=Candidatus Kentrum sp. TC TaxID=2126339 RepID=A0A450Z4D0_9GAMM|nr:MAG: hypothetical protein BECKTC1821E_GA0114239_11232 [Candidatus Kentron sp. TC]